MGIISMSDKELQRLEVIQRVVDNKAQKQIEAAKELSLSYRQIKRLVKNYRLLGVKGLVSRKRGKVSNRKFVDKIKSRVREIIMKYYYDFGPKFASEKLEEKHQIKVNKETLRQWMIEWQIWMPKRSKEVTIHQQRARRLCVGELVQIDGSPHKWFEDRGEECCLIVFTDDATSRIVGMRFVPVETTLAYFACAKIYFKKYGRPLAFYTDRHGIFRVNKGDPKKETQFERAIKELGIIGICANSAPAKGRVERANRTLQDRLIKEMRLRGISNIDVANKYIEEFIVKYNNRFAKSPALDMDKHRKALPDDQILDTILCERHKRRLSKNLELSFENQIYQIIPGKGKIGYSLRKAQVVICRHINHEISICYKGTNLNYRLLSKLTPTSKVVSSKEIHNAVDRFAKKIIKPSIDHPWKRNSFLQIMAKKKSNLKNRAISHEARG